MDPKAFFDTYAHAAQRTCAGTGLCASICLAQAALESNWGESQLTKRANNFGGIKAGTTWKGPVLVLPTREWNGSKFVTVQVAFRAYASPAAYFDGRLAFFKSLPRYRRLFASDDYVAEAHLLVACGYATSPTYAQNLIAIVKRYNLTKYDE